MPQEQPRLTAESVAELAAAAGIRPERESLTGYAGALSALLTSIDQCDALDLDLFEPSTTFTLIGGALDGEL